MNPETEQTDKKGFVQPILFVTAVILFPGILGAVFGWIHMLLPLLVFYYLVRYGKDRGKKYILFGCGLACVAGLVFQIIEQLLFSLTLIPTGFILADSVKRKEAPYISGLKGTLGLIGTWIIVTSILAVGMEHHPYTLLVNSLTQGMDEALAYYKANSTVPAETLFLLQRTLSEMKIWIPMVLPGTLGCITLLITWFTMAGGNRLIFQNTGNRPWTEYRYWVLPERLVWMLIFSAICIVIPTESGRVLGLNILLVSGLLYCFQGTAIMVFYFSKWNVPVFLRAIVYIIFFFQSFGAIFLAVIGVIDVWADTRKLNSTEQETDT
jgi:uncharacterized protein YybS (DUF2232 family)